MITARWVAEALGRCVGCPPYQEMIPGGFGGITGMDLMHALGIASRRSSGPGRTLVRVRYLGAPENPAGALLSALRHQYKAMPEDLAKCVVLDALDDWQRPDTCTICNGGLSNELTILKDAKCPSCGEKVDVIPTPGTMVVPILPIDPEAERIIDEFMASHATDRTSKPIE